jgi:hypothetical protein
MNGIKLFLMCCIAGVSLSAGIENETVLQKIGKYNVVWNTQSKNSSESMPLAGGDIGCNVWVENGDILFYLQRSGSFDENSQYLKMGRFRVQLNPNPFKKTASFRQELILADGYIEIESKNSVNEQTIVKLWVDVFHPVVHVEVNSSDNTDVTVCYESWRTSDKTLSGDPQKRERFAAFNLEGYPGEVIKTKDIISRVNDGVLFYHRNPEKKLIPEVLIKEQGLEASANLITDDFKKPHIWRIFIGKWIYSFWQH